MKQQKKSEKEETKYKNKPKNENNLYNKKEVTGKTKKKIVYRRINHLECIVSYITYNSKRILEVKQESFNTIILVS